MINFMLNGEMRFMQFDFTREREDTKNIFLFVEDYTDPQQQMMLLQKNEVMQEKIDFFKSNSGMSSIDYNAISGQLTILNGKQQILCQRDNLNFDLFKELGVKEEDVQYIQVLLHQTSVQNKEISAKIKATVENNSQMYRMKLHTLWSPLKKDGYIGISGYFEVCQ
ncbi:Uncharacterised protein [uncultured Clostridium sp.]|uniref:Uncharacterized protein n=1 Tax=Muricoprocola aceti TaxID=2981772 RepID=A0ABT2SPT3_9FIRM|nr:hypothetical protein [Muricoprocola aceti]MCU6726499.1 hypothetical protein [Muricoprocola aceti]SCH92992.1 Uncharacterised protein [uncultured Clostridium sp.]